MARGDGGPVCDHDREVDDESDAGARCRRHAGWHDGRLLSPACGGTADKQPAFRAHPALTTFSFVLAYAFPMVVGVTSSVVTRYKHRRIESVADFPDRKPDPVFRTTRDGRLFEVGATTLEFFRRYKVDSAQAILGQSVWSEIVAAREPGGGQLVFFDAENSYYVVSYAPTAHDQVNVYMTQLPRL